MHSGKTRFPCAQHLNGDHRCLSNIKIMAIIKKICRNFSDDFICKNIARWAIIVIWACNFSLLGSRRTHEQCSLSKTVFSLYRKKTALICTVYNPAVALLRPVNFFEVCSIPEFQVHGCKYCTVQSFHSRAFTRKSIKRSNIVKILQTLLPHFYYNYNSVI